MNLKTLGKHILIEYYNCDQKVLENHETIEVLMNEAAKVAQASIVKSVFHQFNPYGVSGVIVIQESHLTIHTWPEYGYAAVDIFTCGDSVDNWKAFRYLEEKLNAQKSETSELPRGVLEKIQQYKIDE